MFAYGINRFSHDVAYIVWSKNMSNWTIKLLKLTNYKKNYDLDLSCCCRHKKELTLLDRIEKKTLPPKCQANKIKRLDSSILIRFNHYRVSSIKIDNMRPHMYQYHVILFKAGFVTHLAKGFLFF